MDVVEEWAPLQTPQPGYEYHDVALRHGFRPAIPQRHPAWYRARHDGVGASAIATIMGDNEYGFDPLPPGMTRGEANRLSYFNYCVGIGGRAGVQDTADLLADHMRRGIHGEDAIKTIANRWLGLDAVGILEMPAIPCANLSILAVSPDGLCPRSGRSIEIKMPVNVNDAHCGRFFTLPEDSVALPARAPVGLSAGDTRDAVCRAVPMLHGPARPSPADAPGHAAYEDEVEAFYECVVDGIAYGTCPECVTLTQGVYTHQVQAQMEALDAPAAIFIKMRSPATVIEECLGIPQCRDTLSATQYPDAVARFSSVPFETKHALTDYISVVDVARDRTWLARAAPVLTEFFDAVVRRRHEIGMTYEKWVSETKRLEKPTKITRGV